MLSIFLLLVLVLVLVLLSLVANMVAPLMLLFFGISSLAQQFAHIYCTRRVYTLWWCFCV